MNLQSLLGELPKFLFVEQYFHALPYSAAGTARPLCEFGTWETLGTILGQPGADVMVVRDGQQYAGRDPKNEAAARQLSDGGYTILVRHAERHHEQLNGLAQAFAEDFLAPVNIHLYATPAGRHGFSWHYDAEDVFIVQTAGQKEYSLRKNTVQPWPLVETIPDDMGYPAEMTLLMQTLLTAGDWLYIPCGYWHKAEAPEAAGETAISLAIGVMSPAAIDVFDFLRPQLLRSLVWRQRLPVCGAATGQSDRELLTRLHKLLKTLSDDLAATLCDERTVREFLENGLRGGRPDS